MPDQKTSDTRPDAKSVTNTPVVAATSALIPAGEATSPAVHQLLAELETARTNGAEDDVQDLIAYLAELGYKAG